MALTYSLRKPGIIIGSHLLQRMRELGPVLVLLSILPGSITALSLMGRTPKLYWCDVILLSMFFLELLASKGKLHIGRPDLAGIFWLYFAYLAIATLSLCWTEDLLYSIAILKLRFIPLFSFLYIIIWYEKFGNVKGFFKGLTIFGIILGIQILWNYYQIINSDLPLQNLEEEVLSTKDLVRSPIGRSNYLASVLIIVIPVLFMSIRTQGSTWWKWLVRFSVGVCMFSLVMTQSRGGIISLIAGSLFVIIIALRWPKTRVHKNSITLVVKSITFAIVVGSTIWYLMPVEVKEDFHKTSGFLIEQWQMGNLAGNREEIWRAGLERVFDNPILGIGLGNQQVLKESLEMFESTHNLYLDTMLELGFIGFITLCGFLALLSLRIYADCRVEKDPEVRRLRFGILATLSVGLVNGFLEPSFWGDQYSIVFWFLVGIGCRKFGAVKFIG